MDLFFDCAGSSVPLGLFLAAANGSCLLSLGARGLRTAVTPSVAEPGL